MKFGVWFSPKTKNFIINIQRTKWNLGKFLPKSVTLSPLFKRKDLKIWLNKIFEWTCQNQISTEDIKLEYLKTLKNLIKNFDNFVYQVNFKVIHFFKFFDIFRNST